MAAPVTNYSVGNTIYGSGGSAATMGTVDPTGYIDRSLNSQSRSGLAQAALSRLQNNQFGGTPQRNTLEDPTLTAATYGGNPVNYSSGPSLPIGNRPQIPGQQVSSTIGAQGSPAEQSIMHQQNGAARIPLPSVAQLSVNPLGQISLPANQSLPLDADLAAQEANQTSVANNQLTQLEQQQQQIGNQYATSAHQAVEAMPSILNSLLSNYASGRGLGFSSGYGNAYNNDQNSFQQQLDQLLNTAQQGITGIQTQASLVPNNLNNLIEQILATQAARNNQTIQSGGILGLG